MMMAGSGGNMLALLRRHTSYSTVMLDDKRLNSM